MSDATKLAEMLCTRFCHDIIGPVGAVSNGAEFLREEMKDVQSQAADLIESSSKEAVARVQFYRQAYGLGNTGSSGSLTDAKSLSETFLSFGKTKLLWDDKYTDASNVEISNLQKKIILNLVVIAAAALIRGGNVVFEIEPGTARVIAKGEMIKLDPAAENCLKGGGTTADIEPKLVQIYYTSQLAKENGSDIDVKKAADSLTFSVKI